MNRPQVTITLRSRELEGGKKEVSVPQGEAHYWIRKFQDLVGFPLATVNGDTPNLPYLGFIAVPEAKEVLEVN